MPRSSSQSPIEVQHEERIGVLQRDMSAMNARFDRHLEIYAQNGKELAALKVSVNQFAEIMGDLTQAVQSIGEKMVTTEDAKSFVTEDRFSPVRAIAYGIGGTAALAVLGSVINLVIK